MNENKKKAKNPPIIDDYTAKKIIKMVDKFYSDPKNQQAFEIWLKEQDNHQNKKNKK